MLYRWRTAPDSVLERGLAAKPGAWEAGRAAVAEHCARMGIDADVGELAVPGIARWYRVGRRVPAGASVAVVVPVVAADLAAYPADRVPGPAPDPSSGEEWLRWAVQAIAEADPVATEVLVVGADDVPREPVEAAAAACREGGRQAVALTASHRRGGGRSATGGRL